jgi:hypothetical protein
MRTVPLAILLFSFCPRLPAPLIPGPNLAKRVDSSGVIVVARVASGASFASGDQISSDLVLHVYWVLKGEATAGSEIGAHLTGRGYFMAVNSSRRNVTEPLYGIWFLNADTDGYNVVSRNGDYGEPGMAPVLLPEGAPAGKPGATPAESVLNEIVCGLQWLASKEPKPATPVTSQIRSLDEALRTLDASTTHSAFQQFAQDSSPILRALGIDGLIEANDPEGVKLAATHWDELSGSADIQAIIAALMGYSNDRDSEAVRALGSLALRESAEVQLRKNASYALRAIHTKDAVPALTALLDVNDERVRINALSGLCLFVRNAPTVTPQAVVSMSWMQSRKPAPLLNPETESHCFMGGTPGNTGDLAPYVDFWRAWWREHQSGIERN